MYVRLPTFIFPILLALPLLLNSCTPLGMVVGAGATAGSMALEERGFEQASKDKLAEARILKALTDTSYELFRRVAVDIVEGRVLLTGRVAKESDINHLLQIVWQDKNTTEVINQLSVGNMSELTQSAYDVSIKANIRTQLVRDMDVKAVNYTIAVFEGQVYVLGIAQHQNELNAVLNHLSNIERVRTIQHYVLMKDSPERKNILLTLFQRK